MFTMCDLYGDNDSRLVVATVSRKLKVFRGTMMAAENPLSDVPSGEARGTLVPDKQLNARCHHSDRIVQQRGAG